MLSEDQRFPSGTSAGRKPSETQVHLEMLVERGGGCPVAVDVFLVINEIWQSSSVLVSCSETACE